MGTPVVATNKPMAGLWQPPQLKRMYYGAGSVEKYLTACLPSPGSRAFIVTGKSLATKTPLVKQVEDLLGKERHAGTFAEISAHAPVEEVERCVAAVAADSRIDTVISIGGGSPIDTAKVVAYRLHEQRGGGQWLHHVTIPTTLSAAECTFVAGFTKTDGIKVAVRTEELAPQVIIYDAEFIKYTPQWLLHSTAIRALDHAVELLYNPTAAEVPLKSLALSAISALFQWLPAHKKAAEAKPEDEDDTKEALTQLQLACFASLYPLGYNLIGSIGLSHTLGYAAGSPYMVPHGLTSCVFLPGVVRLKARFEPDAAKQLTRALPFISRTSSGDDKADALVLADAIEKLIKDLGLTTKLSQYNVPKGDVKLITDRATVYDKFEGEVYEGVSKLVESVF